MPCDQYCEHTEHIHLFQKLIETSITNKTLCLHQILHLNFKRLLANNLCFYLPQTDKYQHFKVMVIVNNFRSNTWVDLLLLLTHLIKRSYQKCTNYSFIPVVWGECNHSFHNCCMTLWVKQNNRCPLCQQDWVVQRIGK